MFYFLQARGNATEKRDGDLVPKSTERSPDHAVGSALLLPNDLNADQSLGVGNAKSEIRKAGEFFFSQPRGIASNAFVCK